MDNISNSIRPSDSHNPQEEMSNLFDRDISVLALDQKRSDQANITKKNLLSAYKVEEGNTMGENESVNSDLHSLQTVKVYLRMKPFPKKLKITQEQRDAYMITNSTTLFTRLPSLDNNASCFKKSNSTDIVCRKFTFTKTFGTEITQLELFEHAVKQQIVDFLAGQNCTIMTYGTTNSGKSYTLQGTTTSPGIIPRALEFVFSNITPEPTPSYKPVNHCDVVSLDPLERAQELEIKTKLLTFPCVDKHQYSTAYKEMQKLLEQESPSRPSHCSDTHYSVWVSFAEIYNETVFDLLSNECQKKRTPLKLATDSQGNAFIKGLKTVCVNSGSEAYQVLMAGQYNLKVAATALNARSSRSHCVFTIKLLKYYVENSTDSVEVSTFAFCDLAGSERLKKTLNIGDRLKEAQNINTSLLVLGRCLKSIHEGQLTKQKVFTDVVGPFRESKLTRLFQKALSGKERLALFVNINPIPNLYLETHNVLSFSAIAKHIVIEQKAKSRKKRKSRFSQIVIQSIKTETNWDDTELENEDWPHTVEDETSPSVQIVDYEDIIRENGRLKKEIAALKGSVLTRDLQTRQEMADSYTIMMKELEANWKNRIRDIEEQQEDVLQLSVKQVEDFYREKLNQLSTRKRKQSSVLEDLDDDDSMNTSDLEIDSSRLVTKIILLKKNIKELKEMNQTLSVEKNRTSFELGLAKEDLKNLRNLLNAAQQDTYSDEDSKTYIEELKTQLYGKQEQVKRLKVFLNEAKEEYIAISTEVRENERLLKEQEEIMVENEEKIQELDAHLQHTNMCLTEKIAAVETLEEKLETEAKKVMNIEMKMQSLLDQVNELQCENLKLMDELKLFQKSAVHPNGIKNSKATLNESEKLNQSLKVEKHQKFIEEDVSSALEIELSDKTKYDIKKKWRTENEDGIDTARQKELPFIEAENAELKQKLSLTIVEIESLKRELECAKIKLNDISDQICHLKLGKNKIDLNEDVEHRSQEIVEKSLGIESNSNETHTEDKIIQTVESATKGESNERSCIDEKAECHVLDAWAKLTVKYEDLKTEYKKKCLRVEELVEKVWFLKQGLGCNSLDELAKLTVKYDDVKTQYKEKCLSVGGLLNRISWLKRTIVTITDIRNADKVVMEEYEQLVELLQNELSLIMEEKKQFEETLLKCDKTKTVLEEKVSNYERRFHETENELTSIKGDYKQCMEKLIRVQEDLDNHVAMCNNEHKPLIRDLEVNLSFAKEKNVIQSERLDIQAETIVELKRSVENVTELQNKITELNGHLDKCQTEKKHLQRLLDENDAKLLDLEDRFGQAEIKERDKDAEIASLQRELKRMIQTNKNDDSSDKIMEIEMKKAIQNLTEVKDTLSRKEDRIEFLEMRLKDYEQNAKVLEFLQQSTQERQTEIERLRNVNEELKCSLAAKEQEMEAFMKNRNEMVTKYETLVESQQDELEKCKNELPNREQTHKNKDCGHTPEEEVTLRKGRRGRPKKCLSPSKSDERATIELTNSDLKRIEKGTLPPHQVEPVSERKRNPRKKKLYVSRDESLQDIEPFETTTSITPSSHSRSLRSRRK